ncbi:MAG: tetratricopeptide repeat protein [Gammaproteobacteria bacterium]
MSPKPLIKVLQNNLKRALRRAALEEAKVVLDRLREEDALALETRGLELEYLIAAGAWEDAASLAEQLLQLFPASARIHHLSGRVRYHEKKYLRAEYHFAESQRLHPHWRTGHWLGKTHTQLGNYAKAEALLSKLLPRDPRVALDLAWLFERWGAPERALGVLEHYLAERPKDAQALRHRLRLKSQSLVPHELVAEVDTLMELGETVPAEMLEAYVQRLFETGQGALARSFIHQHHAGWDAPTQASIAWVCHRLQAYDMALQLFLAALPERARDYKYLSALEYCALRCQRIEQLLAAYESLAPQNNRLYGRMKSLSKRQAGDRSPGRI